MFKLYKLSNVSPCEANSSHAERVCRFARVSKTFGGAGHPSNLERNVYFSVTIEEMNAAMRNGILESYKITPWRIRQVVPLNRTTKSKQAKRRKLYDVVMATAREK